MTRRHDSYPYLSLVTNALRIGALSAFALLLASAQPTLLQAQGILYPSPAVHSQPFYVKNLRVAATITDTIAETTVTQTFVNDSNSAQEGTYLFPIPEGAMPSAFSMRVGDRTLEPKILNKDEARSIYEEIVRRRRDPALLEYVGRGLVRISVFPIPAYGERVITMRYTETLHGANGLRRYVYPLSTSRFGSRPVGTVSVSMHLKTSAAIKNVYSPTHDLSVRKTGEHAATASWEGSNDTSDRDLALYYSTSDEDLGLSIMSSNGGGRDGYFMLLASPRVIIPKERILPKQVVFVLDRTGSMAGAKIEQARKSLLYCLDSLHKEDRFDVITFNESPDLLTHELQPATTENVATARRFVENIEAAGGTNIDEALHAALSLLRNETRPQKMIVFLTDGLPTVGETDTKVILKHVKDLNSRHAQIALRDYQTREAADRAELALSPTRIFCFGLGYDVNVPFLDALGTAEHGDADFVKPEEDVEAKVSTFFAKVASPVLSNVKLAFDGADVYDVYPKEMPDLFLGSQLVVTGRFRGAGHGSVTLTGFANGKPQRFAIDTKMAEGSEGGGAVPRIWAQRKIGWLIDQIRLSDLSGSNSGSKNEVLDEIVRLSRQYGIITEYTSFLVDEGEQRRLGLSRSLSSSTGQIDSLSMLDSKNAQVYREAVVGNATRNGVQGAGATDQSTRARDYRGANAAAPRYQSNQGSVSAYGGGGFGGAAKQTKAGRGNFGGMGPAGPGTINAGQGGEGKVRVQALSDRTFYLQASNIWQDSSYDPRKQKITKIASYSDAHFALIRAYPKLAEYTSVGEDVLVCINGYALQFGKTGKEKLTDSEIKSLVK